MLLLSSLFIISCGKDNLSSNSQSSSASSSAYVGTTSCKMINGGTLGGCCSSHNGAKNCGTNLYLFTSDNKLICNDGIISPSCVGSN